MKSACRGALKAATSIAAALGPGGPNSSVYLLGYISQSLASIGWKYPELAAGIASLLTKINKNLQGRGEGVGNKLGEHKGYRNKLAVAQEALEFLTHSSFNQ